jgi:hypothetical protein
MARTAGPAALAVGGDRDAEALRIAQRTAVGAGERPAVLW